MKEKSILRWDGAFLKKLLVVALPIVLQNLVSASLHIVDGVMIGRLGDAPYAAVVQANRYTFVFQLFLFGAASGCGIFMNQYWGRRDVAAMRQVMGLCFRVVAVIAVPFAAFAMLSPQTVVGFFLPRGESFDYAVQYLRIVTPGYLLAAVDVVYATCMKSAERTSIPMLAGVCSILVNTLLNYLLIYGHMGLPALGVEGAAIATLISGAVALCIDVCAAYGLKLPAAFHRSDWKLPDRAFLKRFFALVLPVVMNEGLWSMGTTMYSVFYGRLGDAAVSAVGIFNTVDQLVFVAIYGVMNASTILVGGNLGAGKRDEAWLTARRMLVSCVVLGVVMGGTLLLTRWQLIGIFHVSQEAKEMAERILRFSAFTVWLRAVNSVIVVGVLRAGGDTVFSMVLDTAALWLVGVPLVGVAALVWHLPVYQVYMFTLVEEIIKASIGLWRYRSKKWMNDLTRSAEAA